YKTIKEGECMWISSKTANNGKVIRKALDLQSHLDMVHQKNRETKFDFSTQGIEMMIVDGWVKANGTTLGADNGMGVAAIMAILQSTEDRKSTRLDSSHVKISYAVFCLKKKR